MKIYNSLTKSLQQFKPIKNNEIKMYVCGITPYDTTHLGHAFTYVFFDTLVRYLNFKGYQVTYVQNVTDIDDDILKRAKEEKRDWKELGDFWTKNFLKDMKSLNVLPPTHFVKATDSIAKMIQIIEALIKKEFAYESGGNVYFSIDKFKDYGNLSRFTKKQMIIISKERGADPDDSLKNNPLDFVLWQKRKDNEPFWDSSWGKGKPGWHIECSAMINQYLGEQIDIHGGGRDLIFPHHESEIAQSESYTGKKPFVKYWMHTSMVIYQGEKMSKSLGNLVMVSDLLKKYSANEIRYILLSHHYRQPWEFAEEELLQARKSLSLILKRLKNNSDVAIKDFFNAMNNDMDAPKALEVLKQHPLKSLFLLLGFSLE